MAGIHTVAVLFLISPPLTLTFAELTTLRGKVVPGVYWEEYGNQFQLYEKVVPLVFEFRLRSELWSQLPIGFNKFKILPRLNCRSDNKSSTTSTADWFFTCPVFYHLNDYLKQFKTNYTDIHPTARSLGNGRQSVNPMNSQDFQKFSHSKVKFDDCEQAISRTWKGINGRDLGLTEYQTIIEKCNTLPSYFESQIQDYNYDLSSSFDSMKENFASYFFINASNPDPGEMINTLVALQSLHLLNTYSEITRFREAVLSCQNQQIPYSYIKASRLDRALTDMRIKLLPLKYTLAVSSISKLYKLPIADCIFGTTTMIVQVLLPVVRMDFNFNFFKLSYPRFLYKDQVCQVKASRHREMDEGTESFLYDRGTKALVSTTCDFNDRELCYVPDQSQRPLMNKCIYEVLNASFDGIRNHCTFQCTEVSPEYKRIILPIIHRVSSSKFIITVDRITTMLIKCEGKPDELITPQIYGAVEITLSCNCHIMYHSEKFFARSPCGNSLFVKHVIPEHMVNSSLTKEKKFFLAEPSDTVNFSLFDENVNLLELNSLKDVSPIDLFTDANFTNANDNQGTSNNDFQNGSNLQILPGSGKENSNDYERCFNNHNYLWVFIAFQTVFFCFAFTLMYFKIYSLGKKWDYGRSAVCFSVSQMTNLDDK